MTRNIWSFMSRVIHLSIQFTTAIVSAIEEENFA